MAELLQYPFINWDIIFIDVLSFQIELLSVM